MIDQPPDDDFVPCTALYGDIRLVPRSCLSFRPTVYAIIFHDDHVLVIITQQTCRFYFPGGGVELGERLETALQREVSEETGLAIIIHNLLHVEEQFFYDPTGEAWHALVFFFVCTPQSATPHAHVTDDAEVSGLRWLPRRSLNPEDFQHAAHNVVEIIRSLPDTAKLIEDAS